MWFEAVAAAVLALQAFTLAVLWRQMHALKRDIGRIRNEVGIPELLLINTLNKIDHRLSMLEERGGDIPEAAAPQRAPELPAMPISVPRLASDYELAQQLAREGADLEQLVTRCGLTRHEAELVLRLYARRA